MRSSIEWLAGTVMVCHPRDYSPRNQRSGDILVVCTVCRPVTAAHPIPAGLEHMGCDAKISDGYRGESCVMFC